MRACLLFLVSAAIAAGASEFSARPDTNFTHFFQRTNGWTAGDGAISIPLADGRVLWLFGDSHLDDLDPKTGTMPCLFQCRNAGLLQEMNDFERSATLSGKRPGSRSWFKNSTNNNEWFWPICGFQNGNTVFVYLSALRKTPAGGMWGWEGIGHDYWAKISYPDLDKIDYVPLPTFNGITFGNGFVQDGTDVYAFGGKQHGLASDLFVARFAPGNSDTNWFFWDGKAWGGNVTKAAPIGRGASTSVHVCKVKGKFLLTTSAFSMRCDEGKEILMAISHSPTGPFAPLKEVYTIQDSYEGHLPFFYLPMAHPEFVNANGEILVTYSINGYEPCVPACVKGRAIPDHYRPKAIRVKLE